MSNKPTLKELKQLTHELLKKDLEFKQVSEALFKTEQSRKESQELAHVGNWDWNVKTGEVIWSEEVYRIFGLDKDTFKPGIESVMDRFHPDDKIKHEQLLSQSFDTGEPYSFEARIIKPDGTIMYAMSTAKGQYDEHGQLVRILGVVQDITHYKKAEEAARRNESFLNILVDSMAKRSKL